MNNIELEHLINQQINIVKIKDCVPNGLQIEGRSDIKHIITGVTSCQELLNIAAERKVDAIIVHHGFFWKNEVKIINGIKRRRLKTLLSNDINLYAWHLPLDIHPKLGNNAQLAIKLNIKVIGNLNCLVPYGEFLDPIDNELFHSYLENIFKKKVLHCGVNAPSKLKYVAWCSGSGQNFIDLAVSSGMDAFITGEVSEWTIHIAREQGLNFYAVGHHATEMDGIRALGKWLSDNYNFDVTFINIPNPV